MHSDSDDFAPLGHTLTQKELDIHQTAHFKHVAADTSCPHRKTSASHSIHQVLSLLLAA